MRCGPNSSTRASGPADTYSLPRVRSLAGNGIALCGVYVWRGALSGTYTTEGITALCEGLKGSAVTSLT